MLPFRRAACAEAAADALPTLSRADAAGLRLRAVSCRRVDVYTAAAISMAPPADDAQPTEISRRRRRCVEHDVMLPPLSYALISILAELKPAKIATSREARRRRHYDT